MLTRQQTAQAAAAAQAIVLPVQHAVPAPAIVALADEPAPIVQPALAAAAAPALAPAPVVAELAVQAAAEAEPAAPAAVAPAAAVAPVPVEEDVIVPAIALLSNTNLVTAPVPSPVSAPARAASVSVVFPAAAAILAKPDLVGAILARTGLARAIITSTQEGTFHPLGDYLPNERMAEAVRVTQVNGAIQLLAAPSTRDITEDHQITSAVLNLAQIMPSIPAAAYLHLLLRLANTIGVAAAVRYDAVFRAHAGIDTTLRWDHLWSEALMEAQLVATTRATTSASRRPRSPPPARIRPYEPPVCRQFNNGNCTLRGCKFRHTCSVCGRDHPATRHDSGGGNGGNGGGGNERRALPAPPTRR
jgi:hypothetical protein